MRALYLDGKLNFRQDCPMPVPAAGEALIRVRLAGICQTDLELLRGYRSFRGIPGHEFVGMVEQADSVPELVGRRVVGEINVACKECPTCQANRPTHCPHRTAIGISGRDGAFAQWLCLPVENLHPVSVDVPDQVVVFAEPLAAACQITQQVHVRPEDRVVVLGDGKLGLLCAQVLQLSGCDLLVIGHHRSSLAILEKRGIPVAISPPGRSADLVVEATGSPGGLADALGLVRSRGTVVLKSTFQGAVDLDLASLVVRELNLVGSRCGPFKPALRLLEQGLVDVEPLVQGCYPLEDGLEAFRQASLPGALKMLIEP